MVDSLSSLFDSSGFVPRWVCGEWSARHGWLHILSDLAIFGAYTAIPMVIAYFVLRRRDVPFPKIFWLFVAFIFACGTTHLIEAIIFWNPIYRFAGTVKFLTAVVSWSTVVALGFVTPTALRLPGLAKLNHDLQREVEIRKAAEAQREDLLKAERKARADSDRANRLKDEFLSVVSHELRTPLNAMLGYAQLLRTDRLSNDQRSEALAAIERNGQAQVRIIDDLLDMNRIVSGKIRLAVRSVSLTEVIEAAIDTIRPALEAKGIQLQMVLDPKAGPVLGDFDRLQQVVWNLLSNAVKFTPKQGKVQICLERVNSHIEVSVADTGQGIAPDFLPFVFDRFRQEEDSTSRRHGGLGLGLAIAKQIVELHGGSVRVKSAGVHQGATFTVVLPLQVVLHEPLSDGRVHPTNEKSSDLTPYNVDLAGVRILMVDDEHDSREIVRTFLEQRSALVRCAATADEALRILTDFQPDVLVSDLGMPEKDGYQLIRQIRLLPAERGGNVPAVALTAFARTEDRKRTLLAGYQSHVAKPVDAGELLAVIAMLSGRAGRTVG